MTTLPDATLPSIPVVDLRAIGPVPHAIENRERVLALRDECLTFLAPPARMMLPVMDAVARRWLSRSRSPYVAEVEAIAAALGHPGAWFLNAAYQWSCTTLAREEAGVPWLARTLDWPFPGLGRRLEVARMRGPAGDFDNVTWPGYVGCLTALAPKRFAVTVNQAPMWRRTKHPWLRPYDLALNGMRTWGIRFIPPDQLLRQVFEICRTFDEARQRLESTPIARPVIYTLVGCWPGERCVIERTEATFATRWQDTGAANDWLRGKPHWEARIRPDMMFTRSYEQAAENSRLRRTALAAFSGQIARGGFGWVTPPVLNPYTRLAVEMCPATGALRAVGYERAPGKDLAEPATLACELEAAAA
jgi:hypothetical protein